MVQLADNEYIDTIVVTLGRYRRDHLNFPT